MKNSVLFVDDESLILGAIRRAVIEEDYVPYFAISAYEALAIMEKTNISVVVTDLRMPTMDGLSMLKISKEKYPDMQRIVLSGYAQLNEVLTSINEGDIHKFITKPWEMDDLLRAIREAVAFYQLKKEKEELSKALERSNMAYKSVFKTMDTRWCCVDRDYSMIKDMIEFTFSQVRDNPNSKDIIDLCETLFLNFVTSTPSYPGVFNLQEIEDGIRRSMANVAGLEQLTMDLSDHKCHGNFRFILFLFDFLSVLSQKHQVLNIVECNVTTSGNYKEVIVHGHLTVHINLDYGTTFLTFLQDLSTKCDHSFNISEQSTSTVISIKNCYPIY